MEDDGSKPKDPLEGKRIFMTAAYLAVEEKGTYGLYRDLVMEQVDEKTGKPVREKLRRVGPIGLFRECEGEEKPDLRTVHPKTMHELLLKNIGEI